MLAVYYGIILREGDLLKSVKRSTLLLFLMTIIVSVLVYVVINNNTYSGDYFDTQYTSFFEFNEGYNEGFEEIIYYALLNRPVEADVVKNLHVTDDEITSYRSFFGDQEMQVSNIMSQYEPDIDIAKENGNDEREKRLIVERDAKIADIKRNFTDDEYVKGKILQSQRKLVKEYFTYMDTYLQEMKRALPYYVYELYNDVDTKDSIKIGSLTGATLYQADISFKASNYSDINYDAIQNDDGEITEATLESVRTQLANAVPHKSYSGTIDVDEQKFKASDSYATYKDWQYAGIARNILLVLGALAVVALYMLKPKRADFTSGTVYATVKGISIDTQIIMVLVSSLGFFVTISFFTNGLSQLYSSTLTEFILLTILLCIVGVITINQWLILGARITPLKDSQQLLRQSYFYKLFIRIKDITLSTPVFIQATMLLGSAFVGGIALGALNVSSYMPLIFILCAVVGVASMLYFLLQMSYFNRIIKDTDKMVDGTLKRDIAMHGKSILAKHAKNLNTLRNGVNTSMNEKAKSERLKTELITNVSHDLRTPLTSIITYSDLLKRENLSEADRQQYVAVIDKKAERLKILIEDLFEVSKMASGSMELQRQRINLTELIQQTVGEYEDALQNQHLDLRLELPLTPVYAYVDGEKWWRLVDNLIGNVCKYAMPGTRVYITLMENSDGEAVFSVKNITKYELGSDTAELLERFKRADVSRHTEGSGLGLAIAQSIVDMHEGRMQIDVDGDLFKVIVKIATI